MHGQCMGRGSAATRAPGVKHAALHLAGRAQHGAWCMMHAAPHPSGTLPAHDVFKFPCLTSRLTVSTAPKVAEMTPMLPTREVSSAYAFCPAHLAGAAPGAVRRHAVGGLEACPGAQGGGMPWAPLRLGEAVQHGGQRCTAAVAAAAPQELPEPSSHEPVPAAGCHIFCKREDWDPLQSGQECRGVEASAQAHPGGCTP